MAVAHSVNSSGGGGTSTNGTILNKNISNVSQTLNVITIGASDTTCIIFIEYAAAATTTGWTVKVGTSTASLISGSSFNTGTVSVIAFEVKSPPSGAQTITGFNSGAAFTGGIASYIGAQTFTGSDTVNPSVAFGQASGTAVATATTNSSGSSIPNTDMVAAFFGNANGDFGTVAGSYGGGASLTFVDHANNIANNVGETFATGTNAAVTMTATQGASDAYAAVGIWVKVPAAAATLPPGRQSFFTPYPDSDTARFPPNLRHWAAPDRFRLIGQDKFPPGQQLSARSPDPQDPFAQWRTWTQTRNPNLVAQDVFPPGKQSYYTPQGITWQPYSPSQNLLNTLLATVTVVTLPPGRQFYDRGPDPDQFAQWRSWTQSRNPNLVGQDAFPPGAQTNYLPQGIIWRLDSPPQNLLNTLYAVTVVATLPPGQQLYDRPPDLDQFAQWRTWIQTRNPNLVGQDAFPPGKQLYDRQNDPFDAFSQWRFWGQTRNPNLVGQDALPPGRQSFDLPPLGPAPPVPAWSAFNINLTPPPAPPATQPVLATYFTGQGMGGMMTNPGEIPS